MEGIYKILRRQRTKKSDIEKLVVYPTFFCNLNCSYCFYHKKNNKMISLKDFRKAFLRFIRISKNPELVFLGGEPTTHRNLIDIIDEAKRINKDIPITLFTNGTLINKKLADYIINNKINLVISLDGNRLVNDSQRKFLKKNDSVYDRVISNLKRYDLIKLTTVNIVVTKRTLNTLNKNINHLNALGFNSIGFNIDYSDNWQTKDKAELKKQINLIFLDYFKKIKNKEKLYRFSNIYEIFDFIKDGKIPECRNLILLPDGRFCLCDKIATIDKKIKEKFIIKTDIIGERNKFFNDIKKMGLDNNQLFCKIGLYLYFRYFKNLKDKKLDKNLNNIFNIQKILKDETIRYIKVLMKNKDFCEIHKI